MQSAGAVVAQTLRETSAAIEPGLRTRDLDDMAAGDLVTVDVTVELDGYIGTDRLILRRLMDDDAAFLSGVPESDRSRKA